MTDKTVRVIIRRQSTPLPRVSEVLSWLVYIDSRCPECTQAEWPPDD